MQPAISVKAHACEARVKAANAAGRSQNRRLLRRFTRMTVSLPPMHVRSSVPPIPASTDVSTANVKGAAAPGARSNRRPLRGFTV
jgi:hypothetical protein